MIGRDGGPTDLRHLIRGLNPQVLTDNGLVAAMDEAASRSIAVLAYPRS